MKKEKTSFLRKADAAFLELLFPRVCPLCGDILIKRNTSKENPYVCKKCEHKLMIIEEPRCIRCSRPVDILEGALCSFCREKRHRYDGGLALAIHDDGARKAIYDLKFSNLKDNADFIGFEMARQIGPTVLKWHADAIIPIPLHPKRLHQRGFNQTQLVAEKFTEFLGSDSPPVDPEFLVRSVNTKPQKELGTKERAKNIRGAFQAAAPGKYKKIILFDDIYTTGSTLSEAGRVAKAAGVETVLFLTISIVTQ